MTLQEYIDEIKLELTGEVLDIELSDEILGKIVNKALREVQRYIDTSKLVQVPFSRCIDLTPLNCTSVTKVYRTKGYIATDGNVEQIKSGDLDPFQAQMWKVFSNNGTMYNLQDYVLNYLSYNTLLQMRASSSTDLSFKEVHNKDEHKLYLNVMQEEPQYVAIEFVPKMVDASDVVDPYWTNILLRLSVALTKVTLGRVRTRYVQNNALWTQDGEIMLNEGTEELNNLRETLRKNSLLFYPAD